MNGISREEVWRILYVEDDRDDFLLTRQILAYMQARTVQLDWAATYDEARDKILHGIYDAILVDYHLGAQTGVDLIREFNSQLEAPFILYTGVDERAVDLEAQLAGVTLFLTKNNATPELLERGIRYAIEHKRNELTLRAITAHLQYQAELLEHVYSPVIATDENLRITFWNKAAEETFGWTEAEVLGQPGREVFLTSLNEPKRDEITRFLIETGHYEGEVPYRHKDGRMISTVVRSSALRDEDGAFRGLVSSVQDITERKQMEQALADSERQFRERVENASTAIYEIDFRTRRFTVINDSMVRLTGYSREELLQMDANDILEEESKNLFAQRVQQWMAGEEPDETVEYRVKAKDGHTIYAILHVTFNTDDQGRPSGATVVGNDITERKRTEAALRESEQRFRAMADGTPVLIWVTDAIGQVIFINQAYQNFFGLGPEDLLDRGWTMLVHPEDTAGYMQLLQQSLLGRTPFQTQLRMRHHTGQWRWIESHGQPRFSETGEYLGIAGSSFDITDRMQAENNLRHYAEELERSNQALQDFASIAAHDLQEPMRKIQAFGRLLDTHYRARLEVEGEVYLQRMISAAERMNTMIQGLLAYSRVTSQAMPFGNVDLSRVVAEVMGDLELRFLETGGHISVSELPVVYADSMQMRQLLQNLISNALKYHRPDAAPEVRVTCARRDADQVEILVQDNGIGFDMKDARLIFNPFTRLHSRASYEGTGIGLAICKKIVERHNGEIFVEAAPGQGATFHLVLPAGRVGS